MGGTAFGPGAALVDREVRKANRGLSTLRDVQALVETLDRLIAPQLPLDILQLLRRARRNAAARRAIQARAALADDPQLASRRDLLVALRGAMLALPWQRVDLAQVQSALEYSIGRIVRAQARAQGSHDDEDWHCWRRRERRLSQQRRALKAGGIAPAVDLPKADKRIATRLGAAQDLGLLREHCGRDSPFAKPDRVRLKRYADSELARQRAAIANLGAGRDGAL
ncbi:MAG: CHAD domain-containing protein [Luteimonas sp.]|nr:CHAD domain-containing protein [Luteimonas sp.]